MSGLREPLPAFCQLPASASPDARAVLVIAGLGPGGAAELGPRREKRELLLVDRDGEGPGEGHRDLLPYLHLFEVDPLSHLQGALAAGGDI